MQINNTFINTAEQELHAVLVAAGERIGAPLKNLTNWLSQAKERVLGDRPLPTALHEPMSVGGKGIHLEGHLELPRLKALDATDQRLQGSLNLEQTNPITDKEMRQKLIAARSPVGDVVDGHRSEFATSQEGVNLVVDQRGSDMTLSLMRGDERDAVMLPFSYERLVSKLPQFLEKHSVEVKELTHQRIVPAAKVFRAFEGLPYMFHPGDAAPMALQIGKEHVTPEQAARAMSKSGDLLKDFQGQSPSTATRGVDFSCDVVDKLFTGEGDLACEALKHARELHYKDQNSATSDKSTTLALIALNPSRFELRADDNAKLLLVDKECGPQGKAFSVEYLERAFDAKNLELENGRMTCTPAVERSDQQQDQEVAVDR
jgi:hypothetical protein